MTDLGVVCSVYQDHALRDLDCKRIQADEIWSFVGAKEKHVKPDQREQGWGSVWTWTAIDADTKLVVSYRVGPRDVDEAVMLMRDLAGRVRGRVQITTDGLEEYRTGIENAFGQNVDYAMIYKKYGTDQDPRNPERRYSPSVCLEATPVPLIGNPDPEHISTSYVERLNLTTRMSVRRFTRLTNAFSKKVANHAAALSVHFMHYNFCRVHKTLGTTPAMAAGVTDHVWKLDELVALLVEAETAMPQKRGPYKSRKPKAISN